VNLVLNPSDTWRGQYKFAWIVVIKTFAINLPFLSCHLVFHIFFHNGLLGSCTLFLQLGCFGLDFTSFCNCILQRWHISVNGCCYLFFFCLYVGRYIVSSALHVHHAYFKTKNYIYFVHINDCRLTESKLNTCSSSAINRLLSNYQPSWML